MSDGGPYAWLDAQVVALRRSQRRLPILLGAMTAVAAWHLVQLFRPGGWWAVNVATVVGIGVIGRRCVQSQRRWAAAIDRALLGRERYRLWVEGDD